LGIATGLAADWDGEDLWHFLVGGWVVVAWANACRVALAVGEPRKDKRLPSFLEGPGCQPRAMVGSGV